MAAFTMSLAPIPTWARPGMRAHCGGIAPWRTVRSPRWRSVERPTVGGLQLHAVQPRLVPGLAAPLQSDIEEGVAVEGRVAQDVAEALQARPEAAGDRRLGLVRRTGPRRAEPPRACSL
ncbi:MAG: hypothetical protein BGO49_16575 [Planctomycetales bacterium 71-10]|nr:MAG: hypothetical protein BGO49_16575 [Planctomycetales bacterium 71-10]